MATWVEYHAAKEQNHVETRILQINDLIAEQMSLMLLKLKMMEKLFLDLL